jgi:hypothetical protein
MGHRYKAHGGDEGDCVGSPGNRWRDWMPRNHGKWKRIKRGISRRIRRENNSQALNSLYEEFQRVDERTTACDSTDSATDGCSDEEADTEEVESHEG